jgi:type I restriction enzyme R subunit
VLQSLKQELDAHLIQNDGILENENFAGKMIQRLVIAQLKNKFNLTLDPQQYMNINHLIVREYLNEFHGRVA